MNKSKKNEGTKSSTALTAVAFQDHLIRSLSLGNGLRPLPPIGSRLKTKKKPAKAVVDTGLNKNSSKQKRPSVSEKEYVLDVAPPPPTLAQKLGLVEAPPTLMSEEEWRTAKHKSNKRQDSEDPCVICKDDFGTGQQVLLSCSHVFHRVCLQAFERFSGKKSCPMCRKEQYQTRVIHEGAKCFREKCATRIQAAWRGYIVRCWFKKFRETNPPKDPTLRKKYFEEKLGTILDRMVKSVDYDLNKFFAELDENVAASRQVFQQWEHASQIITDEDWQEIEITALTRAETECPICLTSLSSCAGLSKPSRFEGENLSVKSRKKPLKPNELDHTLVNHRGKTDKGAITDKGAKTDKGTVSKNQREVVLLSCSHIFHKTCLEMFEELAVGEKANSCPVCRSTYQKRIVNMPTQQH